MQQIVYLLGRKTLAELTEMMEELEYDTPPNGHDAQPPAREVSAFCSAHFLSATPAPG